MGWGRSEARAELSGRVGLSGARWTSLATGSLTSFLCAADREECASIGLVSLKVIVRVVRGRYEPPFLLQQGRQREPLPELQASIDIVIQRFLRVVVI